MHRYCSESLSSASSILFTFPFEIPCFHKLAFVRKENNPHVFWVPQMFALIIPLRTDNVWNVGPGLAMIYAGHWWVPWSILLGKGSRWLNWYVCYCCIILNMGVAEGIWSRTRHTSCVNGSILKLKVIACIYGQVLLGQSCSARVLIGLPSIWTFTCAKSFVFILRDICYWLAECAPKHKCRWSRPVMSRLNLHCMRS